MQLRYSEDVVCASPPPYVLGALWFGSVGIVLKTVDENRWEVKE